MRIDENRVTATRGETKGNVNDDAAALKRAGDKAAKLTSLGEARATAFANDVLPVLLRDAARLTGASDPAALERVLEPAVKNSGVAGKTLGLAAGEKGLAADTDYPPRAANAVWGDFAAALGISKGDASKVTDFNREIGKLPQAEGKYAPAFEQLSPDLQKLATRVAKDLTGEKVTPPLTSTEQAFKANLVLNNLTWHTTNWQRASSDPTRTDPADRNNVFNTYSDNLRAAKERGGLPAVIDMAISDAYNAGKPGVGRAHFPRDTAPTGFED